MGFFETLRRVLAGEDTSPTIAGDAAAADDADGPAPPVAAATAGVYDRSQWHKKLKRILDELPGSRHEWRDLVVEAKALELDSGWVAEVAREEFLLLVRRVVSDRVVTLAEHQKLELARDLIGLPDAEAEAALRAIVAEAETFFGKPVEEG